MRTETSNTSLVVGKNLLLLSSRQGGEEVREDVKVLERATGLGERPAELLLEDGAEPSENRARTAKLNVKLQVIWQAAHAVDLDWLHNNGGGPLSPLLDELDLLVDQSEDSIVTASTSEVELADDVTQQAEDEVELGKLEVDDNLEQLLLKLDNLGDSANGGWNQEQGTLLFVNKSLAVVVGGVLRTTGNNLGRLTLVNTGGGTPLLLLEGFSKVTEGEQGAQSGRNWSGDSSHSEDGRD